MRIIKLTLVLMYLTAGILFSQEDELFNRLPGEWEMSTGKVKIVEVWKTDSQYKLSGATYSVRGNDTSLSETVTIERVNGKLNYMPKVKGQNKGRVVRFVLQPKPIGAFVFENKKHDFPQRIIYKFITDDSLYAGIEGKVKRKNKIIGYNYKRVK